MVFHTANSAVNTSLALDNMEMLSTADRDIVAVLTTANAQVVVMNEALVDQLKNAMENINQLATKTGNDGGGDSGGGGGKKKEWTADKLNTKGYYWSWGWKVNFGHTRKTCWIKQTVHNS